MGGDGEIRKWGLRQLEWDKTYSNAPFGDANTVVERHNREILVAFKMGFEAGKSHEKSQTEADGNYGR